MQPSRETALSEYFRHESAKIAQSRPDVSDATYSCVCFFAEAVNTVDIVATFDEKGEPVDAPPWQEQQQSTVEAWQTIDGIRSNIQQRISDCGLEEYEELWSIGEGPEFEYSSDDSFLADVDWKYLLEITKCCWQLVSINS